MSWSKNRKILYGVAVISVLLISIGVPTFFYLYKAPTCFDNIQNSNEQGVDCGGSCARLCQNSFLSADISWTRYAEVTPHLYNIGAYIVNPNSEGEASKVPYLIELFDKDGTIITDRKGTITLPPHRNTLVFVGAINVGNRLPSRATFSFTTAPNWHKRVDPLSKLSVSDKNYNEDSVGSSLSATINNSDVVPVSNVSVGAVLYDSEGTAIGFSKTILDEIPANGSAVAPFTWAVNRNGKVISIEILPAKE